MEHWNMNPNSIGMGANFGRINPSMATYGYMPPAPRYEVIKVNGEAGAKNFRMAPNSTTLLLDETAAIVWFAQTDGTGYLTVTPYDIMPHQQLPPVDINNLATRVQQLEDVINARQSNTYPNKQSKKHRQSEQSNVDATIPCEFPNNSTT